MTVPVSNRPVSPDDVAAAAERIRGKAIHTPLLTNALLDERSACAVLIKPENLQHIGAFKFRGAYNRLSQLTAEQRQRGVVAFSSGNHAQGVAYAARLLEMPATIVMPRDAPEIKRLGTERHGAQIKLYDRLTESREEIAAAIAADSGATLVPAFDDPHIIAGQGTVGLELMQQAAQMASLPDVIYCPAGGGGLLAGLVTAVKHIAPTTTVVGVEPEAFNDHYLSRQHGERMCIPIDQPTLCDSLMAPAPGSLTWAINSELVDDFVSVTEEQVRHAVSFAAIRLKLTVEPGGAVALAALLDSQLRGKTVGVVFSGGNIDPGILSACCTDYPDP